MALARRRLMVRQRRDNQFIGAAVDAMTNRRRWVTAGPTTMIKAPTDDGETGGGNDDGDGELLAMTQRWFDWISPFDKGEKHANNNQMDAAVNRQSNQQSHAANKSIEQWGL